VGKTTLLGLLLGLAFADGGSLEVLGVPVGRGRTEPDGVTGFVDGPGLYPALTARGNLAALAGLRGRGAPTVPANLEQVAAQWATWRKSQHTTGGTNAIPDYANPGAQLPSSDDS
jgi:ABC-2 type transport system ATP-binding protein